MRINGVEVIPGSVITSESSIFGMPGLEIVFYIKDTKGVEFFNLSGEEFYLKAKENLVQCSRCGEHKPENELAEHKDGILICGPCIKEYTQELEDLYSELYESEVCESSSQGVCDVHQYENCDPLECSGTEEEMKRCARHVGYEQR